VGCWPKIKSRKQIERSALMGLGFEVRQDGAGVKLLRRTGYKPKTRTPIREYVMRLPAATVREIEQGNYSPDVVKEMINDEITRRRAKREDDKRTK
jgi:hypothetical protein